MICLLYYNLAQQTLQNLPNQWTCATHFLSVLQKTLVFGPRLLNNIFGLFTKVLTNGLADFLLRSSLTEWLIRFFFQIL